MSEGSYEIRSRWKVGSECLIYSVSSSAWSKGQIVEIYKENEEEWLSIEYKNRTKDVKRYDTQVLPSPNQSNHCNNVKQEIILLPHNNSNSNNHTNVKQDNDDNIKNESTTNVKQENEDSTVIIQNDHYYSGPIECIIYWDYYNNPIPSTHNFQTIIPTIKRNICNKISSKPIQFRIYSVSNYLTQNEKDMFDMHDIEEINVSDDISITNRMIIDITLNLLESEKNKTSNCIAVISQDKDISHLLSRIHKDSTISNLFTISFESNINTTHSYSNNIDFVLIIPKTENNYNYSILQQHNNKTDEKLKLNFDELNVDLNSSIYQLKRSMKSHMLPDSKGDKLVIRFNHRCLINRAKIGVSGIRNGDTIHWELIKKKKKKKKKPTKRTMSFDNETIEIILENVQTNERIKYNINENDTIHMLRVNMTKTIAELKDSIIDHKFVLIYKGHNLSSRKTIYEYSIHNGDIVKWTLNVNDRNNNEQFTNVMVGTTENKIDSMRFSTDTVVTALEMPKLE